tara:strand:+ start:1286 stop:2734 length:1449 start_codon:yes stop_codon:yes gene_type:complete
MIENEVKQLKINVKNIKSVLISSKETLKREKLKKNTVRKNILNREKYIEKEKKIESKPKKKPKAKKLSKLADSGVDIIDRMLGAGLIMAGGVAINAYQGFKKVFEDFLEENKGWINPIVNFATMIYDNAKEFLNGLTAPEFEDGKYDYIAKFSDDGTLVGGALLEVEKAFKGIDSMVKTLSGILGGKEILAMRNGVEGRKNLKTGAFYSQEWTEEERKRYRDAHDKKTSSGSTLPVASPSGSSMSILPAQSRPSGYNPGKKGNSTTMIYLHWTAGNYGSNGDYHTVFRNDGTAIRNSSYDNYSVNHTEGKNTNAVGLSMAAAAGATGPHNMGTAPPTDAQINAMAAEAARLAIDWGWSESQIDKNVWTHAEAGSGKDPRGFSGHSRPVNYGPVANGGTGERWDLWVLKQGNKAGSGGPDIRRMIKQHYRRFKNPGLRSDGHTNPAAKLSPTGEDKSRANSVNSNGPTSNDGGTDRYFITGEQ